MSERYRREIRFWGRSPDRDADDELRFHIEMRTAELVERGWREADARAEAIRAFGNVSTVKAEVRQHRPANRPERAVVDSGLPICGRTSCPGSGSSARPPGSPPPPC